MLLYGFAPSYLSDLLSPYIPSRPLRLSGGELLCVQRFHPLSMGGRSFTVLAAKLCNSLPLSRRTISTLHEFKSKLKANLPSTTCHNVSLLKMLCFSVCIWLFALLLWYATAATYVLDLSQLSIEVIMYEMIVCLLHLLWIVLELGKGAKCYVLLLLMTNDANFWNMIYFGNL